MYFEVDLRILNATESAVSRKKFVKGQYAGIKTGFKQ